MRRTVALGCLLLLITVACSPGVDDPPSEPGRTLTIALENLSAEELDPWTTRTSAKMWMSLMYDWLVGATPDGEFADDQGVAESWEYSDDGLTWTVTVRDGIEFWDGSPLTVEDAKFSLDQALSDRATSSGASTLQDVIDSTEIVDANTFQVNLGKPFAFLPFLLSRLGIADGIVISKEHCEQVGPDECFAAPMGSGPYELRRHERGSALRFEAVENHWRLPDPTYERIDFEATPEEVTRIARLQQGDADIVQIRGRSADEVAQVGDFTLLEKPDDFNINLVYHEQWKPDNPLSDERVRRAMDLAIDRDEINENILFGHGELVGIGHLGPAHVGWDSGLAPPYPYDPEEAARLLDESGYTSNPERIDVYAHTDLAPELPEIMEAVVGYWTAVGLNVRLRQSEFGSFRDRWGDFEVGAGVSGLSTDNRPVYPLELVWSSEGGLSYTRDPNLTRMIDEWDSAVSTEDAEIIIGEIMQYVNEHHIGGGLLRTGRLYGSSIPAWPGLDGAIFPGELYWDGLLRGS